MSVLWLAGRKDAYLTSGWIVVLSTKQVRGTVKTPAAWVLWNLHTATTVWSACSLAQNMQPFLETKNLVLSMCLVPCLSVGRELLVDFTELLWKWKRGQEPQFQWHLFSGVSCQQLLLVSSYPKLFSSSQICLFWLRLLQSMNAMISMFPILTLGLMLGSPASDLVPWFSDAKQLFGSCNQALLMLAEQVTSMASFLSVGIFYVASLFLSLFVLPVPRSKHSAEEGLHSQALMHDIHLSRLEIPSSEVW